MPEYFGGCVCGAVRIQVTGSPYRVGICHCLDCRKRQGALFHTFAAFPASAVTITGEPRAYKARSFCATCGSSLFDRFGDDEIEIHVGCFDAPDQVVPTYECWVIRRERWLPPFDVIHYERDRAGTGRTEP